MSGLDLFDDKPKPAEKNLTFIWVLIVAAVMAIGAGVWVMVNKKTTPPPAPSSVTEPAKPAPPPAAKPAENKPQAKTAKPAAKHQKKDRHVGKKKSRRRLA